ncbi:integral membrane protein, partial [Streptomyces sviceus ATCC 29083]
MTVTPPHASGSAGTGPSGSAGADPSGSGPAYDGGGSSSDSGPAFGCPGSNSEPDPVSRSAEWRPFPGPTSGSLGSHYAPGPASGAVGSSSDPRLASDTHGSHSAPGPAYERPGPGESRAGTKAPVGGPLPVPSARTAARPGHGVPELPPVSRRFLAKATAVTAALSVAGALLGLVRDQSLARLFGAGSGTDAFLVAWTVPEFASTLLIEDGLAFVLIPAFSLALARRARGVPGDPVRALVAATLPRLTLVFVAASALIVATAPYLVEALAPGLPDPALAVDCTRLTATCVLSFGLAGYCSAALRAHRRFLMPGAIYVAYNAGIITAMFVLGGDWGVRSAAVGVAAGGALMVAVQLPAVWRQLRHSPVRREEPTETPDRAVKTGASRPHPALRAVPAVPGPRRALPRIHSPRRGHLAPELRAEGGPDPDDPVADAVHGHLPGGRAGPGRRRHRAGPYPCGAGPGAGRLHGAARCGHGDRVRPADHRTPLPARRVHRPGHDGHGGRDARVRPRAARSDHGRRTGPLVLLGGPPHLVPGLRDGRGHPRHLVVRRLGGGPLGRVRDRRRQRRRDHRDGVAAARRHG